MVRVAAVGDGFAILLEGAVSEDHSVGAVLLQTGRAVVAGPAGIHETTDADGVAGLEPVDLRSDRADDAHDFVPWHHGIDGHAPFIAHHVEVRMTDPTVTDLDEDVVRTGFSFLSKSNGASAEVGDCAAKALVGSVPWVVGEEGLDGLINNGRSGCTAGGWLAVYDCSCHRILRGGGGASRWNVVPEAISAETILGSNHPGWLRRDTARCRKQPIT